MKEKRYLCDEIIEALNKIPIRVIYLSWVILFVVISLISGFVFLKIFAINRIILGICSVMAGAIIATLPLYIILIAISISAKHKNKDEKNKLS